MSRLQSVFVVPSTIPWTVSIRSSSRINGDTSLKQAKRSEESKLNDYYRRRCVNYERFLCDRVWECAECAKHATRVEPVEPFTLPIATFLRRR